MEQERSYGTTRQKQTLRYKVEKRVHGSEEKAGIQTKTHRAKFQKVSAPAARGYRRVTSTRPNSQDASKIHPPSSKLKYSLFRGWIPHGALKNVPLPPNFKVGPRKIFSRGSARARPPKPNIHATLKFGGAGAIRKLYLSIEEAWGTEGTTSFLDCYNQSEKAFLHA